MSDADQIRADIERTRAELGTNVDALSDKVTPSKIVHRQTDKVRGALGGVRDSVMGTASDVRDSARDAAANTSGGISDASDKAVAKAKGNPLAVGLIAFGVGWLAASLVPASEKEKDLATSAKDAAQPLISEVTDAAKDVAGNLKEPAAQAASAVKDTATDAVGAVKSEATSAADDVKGTAQDAKQSVQDSATP